MKGCNNAATERREGLTSIAERLKILQTTGYIITNATRNKLSARDQLTNEADSAFSDGTRQRLFINHHSVLSSETNSTLKDREGDVFLAIGKTILASALSAPFDLLPSTVSILNPHPGL